MSSTIPTMKQRGAPIAPPGKTYTNPYVNPNEPKSVQLTPKQYYLIGYNMLSFVLWYTILVRIAYPFLMLPAYTMLPDVDPYHPQPIDASAPVVALPTAQSTLADLYPGTGAYVQWIQTLMIVDVIHAVIGVVRAPVVTTTMQVASRFLLVWAVLPLFGEQLLVPMTNLGVGEAAKEFVEFAVKDGTMVDKSANQLAYLGMVAAWCVAECVRYGYFVFQVGGQKTPAALTWARLNLFFVLYPLGIGCECWLVYHAVPFAWRWWAPYAWFLIANLIIYVPGSYILFTSRMSQRRSALKGKGTTKPHTE